MWMLQVWKSLGIQQKKYLKTRWDLKIWTRSFVSQQFSFGKDKNKQAKLIYPWPDFAFKAPEISIMPDSYLA